MSAQAGKDFLLESDDGAGTYTVLGGLRSSSISLNGEAIDVTDQSSGQWQTLLSGAGILKASISGSGIFNNSANEQLALTRMLAQTIANYKIVDGTGKAFAGAWKITKLERKGGYKDAQEYSMTLESSGAVTYA